MHLYKCNKYDLDEVIHIGRNTYFETYHSMNSKKTMSLYLDEAFSPQKIEKEINDPNSIFYFLSDKDVIVAYMKVNFALAQTDLNDSQSLELERIYVKKEFKGCGYGKALIGKTISIAKKYGYKYVWLGVWEKNKPALTFYEKMGFEIFKRHKFCMGDELQNDFVLKKNI